MAQHSLAPWHGAAPPARHSAAPDAAPRPPCPPRDNVLVLDIFFEALNYEMIEQKKAYEVAGLLGEGRARGRRGDRGSVCPH